MGYWLYQDTKSFKIPNVDEEGYIEDTLTGWVLGIESRGATFGTNVILQPKHNFYEQKQLQIWMRSEEANGDFTLRNPKTGMELFSASDAKITITGNATLHFFSFFLYYKSSLKWKKIHGKVPAKHSIFFIRVEIKLKARKMLKIQRQNTFLCIFFIIFHF